MIRLLPHSASSKPPKKPRERVNLIEQALLDWLNANGKLAIALIPLFAFIEACVGIGLFVSGAFLLIIALTLYSNDVASITLISVLALPGALLGDHAGYYLGLWYGPRFHHTRIAARYRDRVARAEHLIRRYGAWAIFIGRFIPAIRSLIPAALGVSGFPRLRFSLLDILACTLWTIALAAIVISLNEAVS